jgi:transposase InsO family protein
MTSERIFRSARSARGLVPYNRSRPAISLPSRKLVVYTIAMNVEPLEGKTGRSCSHPVQLPWNTAPAYLVRDNDRSYGQAFLNRLRSMGIRDRPTAPRSPSQNPYAERLIGTFRRECLDHVLIIGEWHLLRVLKSYSLYYNETRTHLGLVNDFPSPAQRSEPEPLSAFRSSQAYTTATLEHDFRETQSPRNHAGRTL